MPVQFAGLNLILSAKPKQDLYKLAHHDAFQNFLLDSIKTLDLKILVHNWRVKEWMNKNRPESKLYLGHVGVSKDDSLYDWVIV